MQVLSDSQEPGGRAAFPFIGREKEKFARCEAYISHILAIAERHRLICRTSHIISPLRDIEIVENIVVARWCLAAPAGDVPAITFSIIHFVVGQVVGTLYQDHA